MSFKVSNTILDKINKSIVKSVEVVSGTKTLNPSIPTTKIIATSSFDVYLPNGEIGQQKIITTVGNGNVVAIHFNYGDRYGEAITITLRDDGDMIIFWASVNGWYYESRIYD
jgi:hypothetical protein